jgi:predicted lipid-binding transport protein (Tim44 family)
MSSSLIQLLVLAGVAIFLILKLRSVLGTREGFEKPPIPLEEAVRPRIARDFEVIEGGPDRDITDHVDEGTPAARALSAMKQAEKSFSVNTFLQGARGAYEMILMAFEKGDVERIKPFLAEDVYRSFADAVATREAEGLTVDSNFVGISELHLQNATYDHTTRLAEITVRFTGELTSVVRNKAGEVIEGSPTAIKRQRDVWTFSRTMASDDPNWLLVATED